MPTQPSSASKGIFTVKFLLLSISATLLASIALPRLSGSVRASPSFQLARLRGALPLFNFQSRPIALAAMAYEKEQQVAIAAVLKACDVAQATFQKLVNDETVTKKDKSPVTGECESLTLHVVHV